MNGIEVAALVLTAVWLAILSLVMVLVIRQIGLLTVRFDLAGSSFSLANDGPPVGSELPQPVTVALPLVEHGATYLVLASAGCKPCRELVEGLTKERVPTGARIIALIPGPAELASDLVAMLPSGMQSVRDPVAGDLAAVLQIQSAPFAVYTQDGKVVGKTYLHSAADLLRFISGQQRTVGVGSEQTQEVVLHGFQS